MLVTISGPAGSGKSTAAAALAEALGYDHVSGGDIFRDLAEERGMSLSQLIAKAEESEAIDRALDRRRVPEERLDGPRSTRLVAVDATDDGHLRFALPERLDPHLRVLPTGGL